MILPLRVQYINPLLLSLCLSSSWQSYYSFFSLFHPCNPTNYVISSNSLLNSNYFSRHLFFVSSILVFRTTTQKKYIPPWSRQTDTAALTYMKDTQSTLYFIFACSASTIPLTLSVVFSVLVLISIPGVHHMSTKKKKVRKTTIRITVTF